MRLPGVLHNHQSTHARPDEKIGSEARKRFGGMSTGWNRALKQSANAKRRRRDRGLKS